MFISIATLSIGVKLRNQECLQSFKDFCSLGWLFLICFLPQIYKNWNETEENIETKIITFTHFTIGIFISMSFEQKQPSAKIIKVRKDRAQSSILAQDIESNISNS